MTEMARRLRQDMTPAERKVWEAVRDKRCGGIRFLRQHDVGRFVLDFYCTTYKTAIEIDGSIHDSPEAKEHDRSREESLLEENGISFIRFSNDFVESSTVESLREEILALLLPPPTPPS
jgi:very-short-patch-repair endonuclease